MKINKRGMADLEKQIEGQMKAVEKEANRAAARESSPEAKVQAFVRVMRQHGIENIDEAAIRKQFGG